MTVALSKYESLLTKTFQVSLLASMPVALYAFQGPFVLWNNNGILIKVCLVSILLPSAICAPGAMESCVRTAYTGVKLLCSSKESLEIKSEFEREFRRAKGMIRATLFPISGWAVAAQLPVNDFYVYTYPKNGIKQASSQMIKGAKLVNRVLTAIQFWNGLEFAFTYVAVPVGTYFVHPAYRVVEHLATGTINLLRASLGMR
jgi:hypothetical protein